MDESAVRWHMEEAACDYCGSSESTPIGQAVDWRYGLEGLYQIVRCQGCGLVYLNPRPTAADLPLIYPKAYAPHRAAQSIDSDHPRFCLGRVLVETAKRRLSQSYYTARKQGSWLEALSQVAILPIDLYSRMLGHIMYPYPPVNGGRALDVGCGSGRMLKVLKDLGWEVFGFEPNWAAAVRARELVGCNIVVGTAPGSSFGNATFDFIAASHVLEHTVSPRHMLQELHDMLRDGGCLLVVVPNFASVASRVSGMDWCHLDPPLHLFHFDPRTLRKYLCRSGFQIRRIVCFSEAWALEQTLRRKYSLDGSSGSEKGALRLSTRVMSGILSFLGKGDILVAYCTKP